MLRFVCFLVFLSSVTSKDDIDRLLDTVEVIRYGVVVVVVQSFYVITANYEEEVFYFCDFNRAKFQGFIYGIDSKVVELTDDNFNSEMEKFDTAFVEFIAPWCPHCKRLAPDFEKAAKVIKTNDFPVVFVKVCFLILEDIFYSRSIFTFEVLNE